MRRRELQQRNKRDVAGYFLGLVLIQLGLALGVERFWPVVRDPEYDELQRIVRQHQAEVAGRPLVLVMGSSRTKWALRVERLNRPEDDSAPLVLNWGVNGSGPMLHQTFLRRALEAGVRPDLIFLEVLPLALSTRKGLPLEEAQLGPWRLTAAEAAQVRDYYLYPQRLDLRWLRSRVFPTKIHHAELRSLALDVPTEGRHGFISGRDRYGWMRPFDAYTPEETERLTQDSLSVFHTALTRPELSPGAMSALRGMVELCRDERIGVVFVIPPEGTAFRGYAPAVSDRQVQAVHALARELAVPLINAGAWVDDDGFFDGHHVNLKGADQYTRRFAQEAGALVASSQTLARLATRAARTAATVPRAPCGERRGTSVTEAEPRVSDDVRFEEARAIGALKTLLCRRLDDGQPGTMR